MSAEALARVLAAADGLEDGLSIFPLRMTRYWSGAERILADPAPLLAALAEAGVLTRVTDYLPPRYDPIRPRGRGGTYWAAERYVSEWRPDSKWPEVQP